MLTEGAVRRNPLSQPLKGEKVGQEKMFPSILKGENAKNSCQLMSKEFNNEKIKTSKHDDKENLVKDKGIPKSDCRSMTRLMKRGRSEK